MKTKQFKAESKRLLDMMIHSIYTHKEIFLRELISNASDAMDKLYFRSLTDEKVGMNREDFAIDLKIDKDARTLTITDNGIGMTQEELEKNLGTIANSGSLKFKNENKLEDDVDIIGQFGVGFYSAFMVASGSLSAVRHTAPTRLTSGSRRAWTATPSSPVTRKPWALRSSWRSRMTQRMRPTANFWSSTGFRDWSRSIPTISATPSGWI